MSFIFNGLKAAVTISGSITTAPPVPSANQTIVNITSGTTTYVTKNSGDTLYTVTGGKTLYVHSITMWMNDDGYAGLMDNSVAKFQYRSNMIYSSKYGALTQTFPTPLKFSTNVQIVLSTNGACTYSLQGVEV